MGPDGIPVEVCKCMGEEGVGILWTCYRRSMNRRKCRSGAAVALYRYSMINETSRSVAITVDVAHNEGVGEGD